MAGPRRWFYVLLLLLPHFVCSSSSIQHVQTVSFSLLFSYTDITFVATISYIPHWQSPCKKRLGLYRTSFSQSCYLPKRGHGFVIKSWYFIEIELKYNFIKSSNKWIGISEFGMDLVLQQCSLLLYADLLHCNRSFQNIPLRNCYCNNQWNLTTIILFSAIKYHNSSSCSFTWALVGRGETYHITSCP